MAYNENLADRIRSRVAVLGLDLSEKKMFGGLSFLYKGKMTIGIIKDDLCGRIRSPHYEEALEWNHCSEMNFTGRVMKEFILVTPEGIEKDSDLDQWIKYGLDHAKYKLGEPND